MTNEEKFLSLVTEKDTSFLEELNKRKENREMLKESHTSHIRNMIDVIKQDQSYNHAGYVGEVLITLLKSSDTFDLSDIEKMLRDLNSRIHLIALPLEAYGNQYDNFYPRPNGESSMHLKNALWVCMNGKDEAEAMMKKFNTTSENNLVELKDCGFLTLKSN